MLVWKFRLGEDVWRNMIDFGKEKEIYFVK